MIQVLQGIANIIVECFIIWYNFKIEYTPNNWVKIGDLFVAILGFIAILILLFKAFFGGGKNGV